MGNILLKISVEVSNRRLPPPSEWKYDLDLWQNPDPVAKVHDVKLWSDEHFSLMRPYYTMLADAGQKSITAFIIDQPWGPDHVYYRDPTLIKWTKKGMEAGHTIIRSLTDMSIYDELRY